MTVGVKQIGDWDEVIQITADLSNKTKFEAMIEGVVAAEAKFAGKEIRKGIRSQSPGGKAYKPLARTTLLVRRMAGISSTKRLVASGTLVRNIKAVKVGPKRWFVGAPDKVVKGRNLAMVMATNESGATITQVVTAKQRRFLGALFGRAPKVGSTMIIRIPPSPTIEPLLDSLFRGERARRRIQRRATRFMRALAP